MCAWRIQRGFSHEFKEWLQWCYGCYCYWYALFVRVDLWCERAQQFWDKDATFCANSLKQPSSVTELTIPTLSNHLIIPRMSQNLALHTHHSLTAHWPSNSSIWIFRVREVHGVLLRESEELSNKEEAGGLCKYLVPNPKKQQLPHDRLNRTKFGSQNKKISSQDQNMGK